MPGLHTFRITGDGLQVFPRIPEQQQERVARSSRRLGTGVPGLNEMMAGGIPEGDVVMITGRRKRQDDVRDAVRRGGVA
jgi:circadian clock protein KaiC